MCRSSLGYQHFAPLIPSTLMPLGFAIEESDVSSFALSSSAHNASATGRKLMLGECRTGPLAAWRFGGRIVGLVDDRSRVDSWDLRTPSCALMAKQRTKPPRSCSVGDKSKLIALTNARDRRCFSNADVTYELCTLTRLFPFFVC